MLETTFSQEAWASFADGMRDTVGVSLGVLDAEGTSALWCGSSEPACELLSNTPAVASAACVPERDREKARSGAVVETVCAAGLPCVLQPVKIHDTVVAVLLVSAYVNSAEQRRDLAERLKAAGLTEQEAKKAAAGPARITKRQAREAAWMAGSFAESLIARAWDDAEVKLWAKRRDLLVGFERDTAEAFEGRASMAEVITRWAAEMVPSDLTLLVIRDKRGVLQVESVGGDQADALEESGLELVKEAAQEVFDSGRPVLSTGAGRAASILRRAPRTTIRVPLQYEGETIGVLFVSDLGIGQHVLDWQDLVALETYGQRAAWVMHHYLKSLAGRELRTEAYDLRRTARALGSLNDVGQVVRMAATLVDKWVDFEVAGVIVNFGREGLARIVLHSDVTEDDISRVCGEALGGPPEGCEGLKREVVPLLGSISSQIDAREDWTILALPLEAAGKTIGSLFAASSVQGSFTQGDWDSLRELAETVEIALEHASSYTAMVEHFERTLEALAALADAAETYTDSHSNRVMDYAMAIGEEMGVSLKDLETLRFAGLLHDVGMVGVSREILLKPTHLTEEEMAHVRLHAEIGASIVEQMDFLSGLTPVILHHHERWDGKGYPKGLTSTEIPLLARILAVADSFASMTTSRRFRRAMSYREACDELRLGSGRQFDPKVVAAFLDVLARQAAAGATGLLAEHLRRPRTDLPT